MTNANTATRTLTIGRLSYEVSETSSPYDAKVYVLKGARGAEYKTMRNAHHPEMMFVVHSKRGFGMVKALEGVWLTDASGSLERAGGFLSFR